MQSEMTFTAKTSAVVTYTAVIIEAVVKPASETAQISANNLNITQETEDSTTLRDLLGI